MKYSMCLSVMCGQASSTAVNEDKRGDMGFAGEHTSAPSIPLIPVSIGDLFQSSSDEWEAPGDLFNFNF